LSKISSIYLSPYIFKARFKTKQNKTKTTTTTTTTTNNNNNKKTKNLSSRSYQKG
jgi:hypothetical protein